jgi:MFS family permease
MIVPSSLALVSHSVSPSEQGHAIGIWASVTGVGLAIGRVAGGLLTSALSWRWMFLSTSIVAIAFVLCSMSLKDVVRSDTKQRVDWAGFLLMIVGIGSLVSAIVQGPEWGWTSRPTIALAVVAVVSLGVLYIVEWNVKSPILDLALFANRVSFRLRELHSSPSLIRRSFLMPALSRDHRAEPYASGFSC